MNSSLQPQPFQSLPENSGKVAHVLDNPIWTALTADQTNLAEGSDSARRFPASIGPLAGLSEQSESAYAALATLCKPDEQLVLFLPEDPAPPDAWTWDVGGFLVQFVYAGPLDFPEDPEIVTLGQADIPEMLALTNLTNPGPFRQDTIRLGTYVGIRIDGRLAAMAGERLNPPGYTEISAVCTHPDYQGRGLARRLLAAVSRNISQRGRTPFLHTGQHNQVAIGVYEKFGFRQRRLLHLAVIRHQ